MRRALWALLIAGCGASRLLVKEAPSEPYDVLVVPGCPVLKDGTPSRCLLGRAAWAALLYQRGWTRHLIASGGAVHSPFVEAEMLATIMTDLGVPADRIVIEPHALHTDENMFNALQISRALGFQRIGVASDPAQAAYGCRMMIDWTETCAGFAMDMPALEAFLTPNLDRLRGLRVRQVDDFISIDERERLRQQRTGRSRPPSLFLYPMLGYMAWIGKPWMPITPPTQSLLTWDQARP